LIQSDSDTDLKYLLKKANHHRIMNRSAHITKKENYYLIAYRKQS